MLSEFDKHVFVCLNARPNDAEGSCFAKNATAVFEAFKSKVKTLNSNQKIRINRAGCLGHCESGLTMVIYPQGLWYYRVTLGDVDEIIEKSILNDSVIERLQKR